ncbi:MAG: hypothetical protein IT176_14720 [Acidobacteria bacterium]|nr:hypothetical protein [Acidobacteriota bacterium]
MPCSAGGQACRGADLKAGTAAEPARHRVLTPATWIAVLGLAWIGAYAFNAAGLDTDVSWTRSVYLQKRAIAASLPPGPRVLVVGGSGVHYGVDALELERELRMPAVNFGLHAGLGLGPILALALDEVRAGDIVVLIPEFGILQDTAGGAWLSGMFAAAVGRPGLGARGAMDTAREIFRAGVVNQNSLGKGVFVGLFGATGRARPVVDARGATAIFLEGTASASKVEGRMSASSRRRVEAFAAAVRARGAHLLAALPWLLVEADDDASLAAAGGYAADLGRIAPVLRDDRMNLKSDRALFSDTSYHLTAASRTIRSRELAAQIRNALNAAIRADAVSRAGRPR